ncbi:C1q-related factor-like [Lates japonicus]|uniref:C1q-related factor-like protein n=1 Tax=Lates japonicus TaxID=270547 RepID=A0AAD3RF54_LATJO|nr:C1q-related factor-like protein [Lates japonicus]
MRAVVLLCLLHAAFGMQNPWNGPDSTTVQPRSSINSDCLRDQASCGCCLMQKQIKRTENYFQLALEKMNEELTTSKTALNNMRASRSAFSVALTDSMILMCYGPLSENHAITYKHVFLNLGNNYNKETGTFTVTRSGVYSFAVTIFASLPFGINAATCASLMVNGEPVAMLLEDKGQDSEDSSSVVLAIRLNAGDNVIVSLLKGCVVCDSSNHYNTFTGFLLYATD